MSADRVEVVVVGGGVIGLAIARELSLRGHEVLLLEAEAKTGTGISSRNSEVIHAGLYYPTGSSRARLCVEGNRELYAYCEARGVGHARLGKLIVATDPSQEDKLAKLLAQAHENHVHDVVRISAAEAQALEPALVCTAALLSPSTGIVDSHALMEALRVDAIEAGCSVVCGSPLSSARVTADGFTLQVGGDEPMELSATFLINAAGLGARAVGLALGGLPVETVPRLVLAKGNYYGLQGIRAPFARLVYPLPEPGGLGVHLTLDLAGQARFGPDVEWIDAIDYAVDPTRAEAFYASVRRYWPALPDGALAPAYAGIRPKLTGPGEPPTDFLLQGPADHGVRGYLALHGIESPGLTCCLPLARQVATHLP